MPTFTRHRERRTALERIFVDTSAWYALADRNGRDHEDAAAWLRQNSLPLVITNYVLDETLTLLRYRLGHGVAVGVGERLRESGLVTQVAVRGQDEAEAWRLFQSHEDKRWSFTDCTSFTVMRRLKLAAAFAFDDDFQQAGFRVVP